MVGVLRIGNWLFTKEQVEYAEEAYQAELTHQVRYFEDEEYRNAPDTRSAYWEYAAFAGCEGFENDGSFEALYQYVEEQHKDDAMAWC